MHHSPALLQERGIFEDETFFFKKTVFVNKNRVLINRRKEIDLSTGALPCKKKPRL